MKKIIKQDGKKGVFICDDGSEEPIKKQKEQPKKKKLFHKETEEIKED